MSISLSTSLRPSPAPKTGDRGYGHAHRRLRASLAPVVARGTIPCSRCGECIAPGAAWDLDHDATRTGYLGPAHRACNRAAGAVESNRRRGLRRLRPTRVW